MVGMSNFTLDPATIGVGGGKKYEIERKALMDELMAVVKECQKKYGGKTELATESDSRYNNNNEIRWCFMTMCENVCFCIL